MGPEYRFGGRDHPLRSLLASFTAEAGPSPGGSSSFEFLAPALSIPNTEMCLNLKSYSKPNKLNPPVKNFIECFLGINMKVDYTT